MHLPALRRYFTSPRLQKPQPVRCFFSAYTHQTSSFSLFCCWSGIKFPALDEPHHSPLGGLFSGVFIVCEENQTETLPRKKKKTEKLKTVSSMHGAIAPFSVTSNAGRKWRSVRHSRGPPINSNESLTSIS